MLLFSTVATCLFWIGNCCKNNSLTAQTTFYQLELNDLPDFVWVELDFGKIIWLQKLDKLDWFEFLSILILCYWILQRCLYCKALWDAVFWWTELYKSLNRCARTQPSPSSTVRPAPCSSRTAAPGHWHCPRPHWCSSWPWWQPSVGSPGTTSTPHPRWCKRAARRGKSSHWERPPPSAYWKKVNQTAFIDSLLLLASLFTLLLILLKVFISMINFTRIQILACNL